MAQDFREKYIETIVRTLESEDFKKENTNDDSGNGFTRKRKLTFTYLVILITQGLT